jgi:hypothetical protein
MRIVLLVLCVSSTELLLEFFLGRFCLYSGRSRIIVLFIAESAAGLAPLVFSSARHQ